VAGLPSAPADYKSALRRFGSGYVIELVSRSTKAKAVELGWQKADGWRWKARQPNPSFRVNVAGGFLNQKALLRRLLLAAVFHDFDFVLGQAVEPIDPVVYLPFLG
jgi:hypothetical protein